MREVLIVLLITLCCIFPIAGILAPIFGERWRMPSRAIISQLPPGDLAERMLTVVEWLEWAMENRLVHPPMHISMLIHELRKELELYLDEE